MILITHLFCFYNSYPSIKMLPANISIDIDKCLVISLFGTIQKIVGTIIAKKSNLNFKLIEHRSMIKTIWEVYFKRLILRNRQEN